MICWERSTWLLALDLQLCIKHRDQVLVVAAVKIPANPFQS